MEKIGVILAILVVLGLFYVNLGGQKDPRVLLKPNTAGIYTTGIDQKTDFTNFTFNTDSPTTTVNFSDPSYAKIEFLVPYNSNWGNEEYKINPHDIVSDSISPKSGSILFGWVDDGKGGTFNPTRQYVLVYHSLTELGQSFQNYNISKLLNDSRQPNLAGDLQYQCQVYPVIKQLGGIDAVESVCDDSGPRISFLANGNLFEFYPPAEFASLVDIREMEHIMQTVKVL
ncbi:MAG: hypothetical protein V1719_01530 [Patescibacteria group bacterium]